MTSSSTSPVMRSGTTDVIPQMLRYTVMLARAYLRDRSALFFSLVLPLMLMLIFGALNLGSFGHVRVGIADQARNADSARFI